MQCNGRRLKQRTHFKRNAVGDFYRILRRNRDIFGKRALLAGADKLIMTAKGIIPAHAVLALHTGLERNARDTVADREGSHALAKLRDLAGKLMSQNNREEMRLVAPDTGNIAAADAALADANQNFSRRGLGRRPVSEPEIAFFIQNCCFHLCCILSFSLYVWSIRA